MALRAYCREQGFSVRRHRDPDLLGGPKRDLLRLAARIALPPQVHSLAAIDAAEDPFAVLSPATRAAASNSRPDLQAGRAAVERHNTAAQPAARSHLGEQHILTIRREIGVVCHA